jgi:tRNA 2-thiouridine synthesizing protein A
MNDARRQRQETTMTRPTPDIEVAATADTSGMLCPLPVFRAALALGQLEAGQVLELICTDPGSLTDIPAFARRRGDTLLAVDEGDATQVFWLQKGEPR